MNSTPISGREADLITAITDRDVVIFRPRDVERFLNISRRNVYRILGNMREKGLVRQLGRGTYILTSVYEEMDSYAIASHLEPASYIGFWSALHFHGMTSQVPGTIFVAVTKPKRSREVQGQEVQFVRVAQQSFFGYDRYGDAVVSDREKTIVDCLRLPDHAGGIGHIARSIPEDLDIERIVHYAERLDSGAVASRLGFLLERADLLDGRERLGTLIGSYTKLDPSGDRTGLVPEWKLYANVRLDDGQEA